MATEAELAAPTPRYAIGDTVYIATTERTVEKLPCPDCLGEREWKVQSPAGGEYTTPCPRCGRTYSLSENMPSLQIERHVGKAQSRLITGLELDARPSEWRAAVTYRCSTGGSSWNSLTDKDVFATQEAAQIAADLRAAEMNTKSDETPQVLASRRFSSLTLDDARFDQFKNGVWNAHYHAGALLERVKTALDGEDGNEERSASDIIEDLREAARWDFSYHVEHLPLTPLVKAAMASDDPAVRDGLAKLPEVMVALLSGKTLADMQPKRADFLASAEVA